MLPQSQQVRESTFKLCPCHNHHATFHYPIFLGFLSIWKFPVLPEFYHREKSNIKKLFLINKYARFCLSEKYYLLDVFFLIVSVNALIFQVVTHMLLIIL